MSGLNIIRCGIYLDLNFTPNTCLGVIIGFRQRLSEPEFYGDLVYKLKKIVGSDSFSA